MGEQRVRKAKTTGGEGRNWLTIATSLSLAFGAFLVALTIWRTTSCPGWTTSPLCTLPANELGDMMAGIFAPLAFIWLAAAVLLQSQELAAQRAELAATREELSLTREEHVASRRVMEEQAQQASRQASYVEAQTNFLTAEHAIRRQETIDRECRSRIEAFRLSIERTFEGNRYQVEEALHEISINQFHPKDWRTLTRELAIYQRLREDKQIREHPNLGTLNIAFMASDALEACLVSASETLKDDMKLQGFHELKAAIHAIGP